MNEFLRLNSEHVKFSSNKVEVGCCLHLSLEYLSVTEIVTCILLTSTQIKIKIACAYLFQTGLKIILITYTNHLLLVDISHLSKCPS